MISRFQYIYSNVILYLTSRDILSLCQSRISLCQLIIVEERDMRETSYAKSIYNSENAIIADGAI